MKRLSLSRSDSAQKKAEMPLGAMSLSNRSEEMPVSSLLSGKAPSEPRQASTVTPRISSIRKALGASGRRASRARSTRARQRHASQLVPASTAASSASVRSTG